MANKLEYDNETLYFWREFGSLIIWGYECFSPFEEDRDYMETLPALGQLWTKAFSTACPAGEVGITPKREVHVITREIFDAAQESHWKLSPQKTTDVVMEKEQKERAAEVPRFTDDYDEKIEEDNLPYLFAWMEHEGVDRIVVAYDGYGDSGEWESAYATSDRGGRADMSKELASCAEEWAYSLVEAEWCGWETDEGSHGSVEFVNEYAEISHYERYIDEREHNSSPHMGDVWK